MTVCAIKTGCVCVCSLVQDPPETAHKVIDHQLRTWMRRNSPSTAVW